MATGTNIVIENMVYQKIMHWVNKSDYEVSGLGKITYVGGTITVIDAMLLPQKNGKAHTDIEGPEVGKAMYALRNSPGDLRFWWHSHVDMSVFWSGQDMNTIEEISAGGWFVATVFNKKREMRSCLNMVSPVPLGLIDNIPTRAIQFLDPELIKQWDADYEKNVENMVSTWGNGGLWTAPELGGSSVDEETGQLSLAEASRIERRGWKKWDKNEPQRLLNDARRRVVGKSGPPQGPNGMW